MRTTLFAFAAALPLLLSSCSKEPAEPPKPATPPGSSTPTPVPAPDPVAKVIKAPEIHRAVCGHVLEQVGHCGNYVQIDGRYVEILWPELGVMEWCKQGQAGAEVEITGAMKDGKWTSPPALLQFRNISVKELKSE